MGLWSRLKRTFRNDTHTSEIEEELQFHLHMDMADGHDRREANLRLGNVTRLQEDTRAMGIVEWLDSVLQDVRYGLRQLRKTPALVAAVVLSLAIGIGANTAIFNLIDAALLRPLPVKDPDALRIVEWTNEGFVPSIHNVNGGVTQLDGNRVRISSVTPRIYRTLARQQTGFDALIGVADPNDVAITVDSSPADQMSLQYVSANYFQGLGIAPIIGRPFNADEDQVGREPVVVLSHRFWTNRLAASPDVLNRSVLINNVSARVIGIAPPGFFGLRAGQWTDVYTPIATRVAVRSNVNPGSTSGEDDHDWWIRQIARVKPSVPEQAALAQLNAIFQPLALPDDQRRDAKSIPVMEASSARRGFNALNARDSNALWILMLLVGVLLLIVCANVANLLLSRSVSRQRESAVRQALGAPRLRVFRQHLIESTLLAVLGGAAGLALGYVFAESIHTLFQAGQTINNAFDLHIDLRVLLYSGALSILTALLFGLAPAVRAARSSVNDALKSQTRSVAGGRLRLPRALVAVQIALCLTGLVAAGLLGRTLGNLKLIDIGFERENLAYATLNPMQAGYTDNRLTSYVQRVREEIAGIPGVASASAIEVRPLSGNGNATRANFPGRPYPEDRTLEANQRWVTLNRADETTFETLGMRVVLGRAIERRDMHPDAQAIVVDELFVRRFFPNGNPLGQRFGFGPKENSTYEIVGVVSDSRYRSLRDEPAPTVYRAFTLDEHKGPIHFAIRTSMDSASLASAVRQAVAAVDAAVPVTQFHTQTALIDRLLRTERLLGFLSGAFGVVALTLAAIGLGGLLAYNVSRRTNEIGVRMALGAAGNDVVRMVLRDSLWMVAIGLVIGLPCAYAMGGYLKTMLFNLEPLDPLTAALSFVALAAVAIIAAWIPARRAARIDPLVALREE